MKDPLIYCQHKTGYTANYFLTDTRYNDNIHYTDNVTGI